MIVQVTDSVSSENEERPFDSKAANAGEGDREENATRKSLSFHSHFTHPSPVQCLPRGLGYRPDIFSLYFVCSICLGFSSFRLHDHVSAVMPTLVETSTRVQVMDRFIS